MEGTTLDGVEVVILAAGKGTRMKGDGAKVLHGVCGRPMLEYVLDVATAISEGAPVVVVGHEEEKVQETFSGRDLRWVLQGRQLGTGHAVLSCREELEKGSGPVVVLNGDQPLLSAQVLLEMLGIFEREEPGAVVLTAVLEDPANYGRIVRNENRRLVRIVEEHDAGPEEREIREVNGGAYVFNRLTLLEKLQELDTDNAQGEYYLTDVIHQMLDGKGFHQVIPYVTDNSQEILSVTTRWDIPKIAGLLMDRYLRHLAQDCGVTIVSPENTYIEPGAQIGHDTIILPFTFIERDVRIGSHCKVGPFSHLRAGTVLADRAEIGNFTETKKTVVGEGSKAKHLSYLGDAIIGKKVNIGAGTICANYDGKRKHQTVIDDGTHVGSGTVFVAPVKTGRNAVTGAGAVVTAGKDVPDGETVVGVPAEPLKKRRKKEKK